jgi:hypothetical protein
MKERELSAIEKEINDRDIPMQHAISGSYTNENILNNSDGDEDEAETPALPEKRGCLFTEWYKVIVTGDVSATTEILIEANSERRAKEYAKELAKRGELDNALYHHNESLPDASGVHVVYGPDLCVGVPEHELPEEDDVRVFTAPVQMMKLYRATALYRTSESVDMLVWATSEEEAVDIADTHTDEEAMKENFRHSEYDVYLDCITAEPASHSDLHLYDIVEAA